METYKYNPANPDDILKRMRRICQFYGNNPCARAIRRSLDGYKLAKKEHEEEGM